MRVRVCMSEPEKVYLLYLFTYGCSSHFNYHIRFD